MAPRRQKSDGLSKKAQKVLLEQKIIEKVRTRPFLYNKQHPGYKDTIIKMNAWQKIFEEIGPTEFGTTPGEYAEVWSSLWAQYLAFKKKVAGTTGKAGGSRITFRHEQAMQFFEDKGYEERSLTNVDMDSNEEQGFLTTVEFDRDGTINIVPNDGPSHPELLVNTPERMAAAPLVTPPSRSHSKKKSSSSLTDFEETIVKALAPPSEPDEYEAFAKTVAAKLRKIASKDDGAALDAQFKIFSMLMDTEKGIAG